MRTDEPHPIRLQDYRPPDWLVDTVELDVSLDASATRVRAALLLRPNPKAAAPAPLVLDGDGLALVALKLDGEPLAPAHYVATPDRLALAQPPQRPFRLEIETRVDPSANTRLMGLYRSGKTYCTQCEAEGFRRITYFPDRPDVMAVYTTRIEADIADAPVLLANGNLKDSGTVLSVRTGGWHARRRGRFLSHDVRTRGDAADLCGAGQGGPLRLRHGLAHARHALGRAGIRPRI
jgi:aminopeptidase N